MHASYSGRFLPRTVIYTGEFSPYGEFRAIQKAVRPKRILPPPVQGDIPVRPDQQTMPPETETCFRSNAMGGGADTLSACGSGEKLSSRQRQKQ
jgi:hypothetical protein